MHHTSTKKNANLTETVADWIQKGIVCTQEEGNGIDE
jgi:hypothetical protein